MRSPLPPDWQVPALFGQRLGDSAGRQRAMAADGHLLLVLHEPPRLGKTERAARLFWRDPAGAWKSSALGDGVNSLKRHIAEIAELLEQHEKRWQAAQSAGDYFLLLRGLAPLQRSARNLHAVLQQAREWVPDDRDLINLRDQAGELDRAIELLHGDAKMGLDFTIAHQTEQQAERSHDMAISAYRLNLLAAAFFPLATLSAIFGMNLSHGLEGERTYAVFWVILGVGLLVGLGLATFIARKPEPAPAKIRAKPRSR